MRLRFLVPSALFFATPVWAGIPMEQEVECPIGDQVITVMSTASCTSFGSVMNMTRRSSCDFVTRVPDCSETGLPLYRPFADDELIRIEAYLVSDDFEPLRENSRFKRAFAIERHLMPDGPHANALYVLLEAYQDDPATAEDPVMMEAAEATAERLLEADASGSDALLGMVSVAAWHAYAGRESAARAWLGTYEVTAPDIVTQLQAAPSANQDALAAATFFSAYAEQLEACLGRLGDEGCRADDPVKLN
jgi:hypothetical protein